MGNRRAAPACAFISGDRDKLVKVADTRRVADALPNAALTVIPGCGHVLQEECPRAFEQAVADWLVDHPGLGLAAIGPTLSSGQFLRMASLSAPAMFPLNQAAPSHP